MEAQVGFVVDKVALEQGYLSNAVFPYQYNFSNAPYLYSIHPLLILSNLGK
jgi:hypothetical protein